jgi:hypothetical protein
MPARGTDASGWWPVLPGAVTAAPEPEPEAAPEAGDEEAEPLAAPALVVTKREPVSW